MKSTARPNRRVRVAVAALVLLFGCGPAVSLPPIGGNGSATGTSGIGDSTTEDASTIQPLTSTTSRGSSDDSAASDSSGSPECEPLPEVSPGLEPTWCTADPFAVPLHASTYVGCLDGSVSFRQSWASSSQDYLFYDVYAQFYSVVEDASGSAHGTTLDPYDGSLDDCALYDSTRGSGSFGEVVFETAGTVTFSFGKLDLPGERSTSGEVIAYSAAAADEGFVPQFLAPHGFSATADDISAVVFPAAVTLPDPIVVTTPPADRTTVVDRNAITLEWEPSALDIPLDVTVQVAPEGQLQFQLFCRMKDDGNFTIPPALACHLPPTEAASLIFNRADRRLITTEDGRNIAVVAGTRVVHTVTLE